MRSRHALALGIGLAALAVVATRLGLGRDSGPVTPDAGPSNPEGQEELAHRTTDPPSTRTPLTRLPDRDFSDLPVGWGQYVEPYDEAREIGTLAPDQQAVFTGRFLDLDADAVPGVPVVLLLQESMVGLRSGDDGRFRFAFDPGDEANYTLSAWPAGFSPEQWEFFDIGPGAEKDVGDVRVRPTGELRVRIVDPLGRSLSEGWRIEAKPAPTPSPDADSLRLDVREPTPEGTFVLHAPAGPILFAAVHEMVGAVQGPELEIVPGQAAEVALTYDGPPLDERVVVEVWREPIQVIGVLAAAAMAEGIRLIDEHGATRLAEPLDRPGLAGPAFVFDRVPKGEYRLDIEVSGSEPWSRDDVQPGTFVFAKLGGLASLVVETVDAATGEAAPDVSVSVGVVEPRTLEGGALLFDGLSSGTIDVDVSARGYADVHRSVALAREGETRVHIELQATVGVHGHVLFSDGSPAPGVFLTLTPALADDDVLAATTDRQGRYEAEVRPGIYEVSAAISSAVVSCTAVVERAGPACDLTLPELHAYEGRLTGFGSFDVTAWSVETGTGSFTQPDPGGRFRLEGLSCGEYDLFLRLPAAKVELAWASTALLGRQGRRIGTIRVPDGPGSREFDVSDRLPGSIELRVTYNGSPASAAWISLHSLVGDDSTAGVLDSRGVTTMPAVWAGSYLLEVWSPDDSWRSRSGRVLTVHPGEPLREVLDLADQRGRLKVLDSATGLPANGARIVFFPPDPALDVLWPPEGTTDADGLLEITLPLGSYEVCAPALDPKDPFGMPVRRGGISVRWTAAGPQPARITLTLPEGPSLEEILEPFEED